MAGHEQPSENLHRAALPGKYSRSVEGAREPDPIRAELIQRWNNYLEGLADRRSLRRWLDRAFIDYRDEIVHTGLLLFNDHLAQKPSPEKLAASRSSYNEWLKRCADFDADPDGWERGYWRRYLLRLRDHNTELAVKAARGLRRDPLTSDDIIEVFGSDVTIPKPASS